MAFAEDFSVFFDTDEFASEAFYDGASVAVNGIFDCPSLHAPDWGDPNKPTFRCAEADIGGDSHGKALLVGGAAYKITHPMPDGTGLIVLILELVPAQTVNGIQSPGGQNLLGPGGVPILPG